MRRRPSTSPSLTLRLILSWADHHRTRMGKYPHAYAGAVLAPGAPLAMNWRKIDNALRLGYFGLPGGHSLAGILEKHRGRRKKAFTFKLTDDVILSWADTHRDKIGKWPNENSGPVHGQAGEVWLNVSQALRGGHRGLEGGRSLAKLIADSPRVRNKANVPRLTIEKILEMADRQREETGDWPKVTDGAIVGYPGETWLAINSALHNGVRGLAGGLSLAEVLRVHRGRRNKSNLPRLTKKAVVKWARAHRNSARASGRDESPGRSSTRRGRRGVGLTWRFGKG